MAEYGIHVVGISPLGVEDDNDRKIVVDPATGQFARLDNEDQAIYHAELIIKKGLAKHYAVFKWNGKQSGKVVFKSYGYQDYLQPLLI